jgi:hypothetical protein
MPDRTILAARLATKAGRRMRRSSENAALQNDNPAGPAI